MGKKKEEDFGSKTSIDFSVIRGILGQYAGGVIKENSNFLAKLHNFCNNILGLDYTLLQQILDVVYKEGGRYNKEKDGEDCIPFQELIEITIQPFLTHLRTNTDEDQGINLRILGNEAALSLFINEQIGNLREKRQDGEQRAEEELEKAMIAYNESIANGDPNRDDTITTPPPPITISEGTTGGVSLIASPSNSDEEQPEG